MAVVVILMNKLYALLRHSFECAVGEEGTLNRRDVLLVGYIGALVDDRAQRILANKLLVFFFASTYDNRSACHCRERVH